MKKRVIVFCDYYLPSLGGGGGAWAIANIVDRFSDRYEFFIVTGNRNARGSSAKISGVVENQWNPFGKAQVFYQQTSQLDTKSIRRKFEDTRPDIVFLNSVFSVSTRRVLSARRKGLSDTPVVIAPCGELLPGALAIKARKKKLFLAYGRWTGLFQGLIWRASFESEAESIRAIFGDEPKIRIAADLTPKTILPNYSQGDKPKKAPGNLRLVFLSRIDRKKNLHFLLERLAEIKVGDIELEIIGPVEDLEYWAECAQRIETLPNNFRVSVLDAMDNASALNRLLKSHFFVLPTLSENFGYVCIEALAAGCPLIISNRTDWSWVEQSGAGWAISLDDRAGWSARLTEVLCQPQDEFDRMSGAARAHAVHWLANPSVEAATAELFEFALEKRKQ